MKRVTQKNVAELAGVSRATVSYVLNGKTEEGVPISEETRKRVLEAIEKSGYSPNQQARTLRSGRTMTIGIFLIDIHNPHFWQHLAGIEREAHKHGYIIMLFHTALKKNEEHVALNELSQKRIDGAIINTSYVRDGEEKRKLLAKSHLAIVDMSAEESPFDRIKSDYHRATKELMAYLYGEGHRRFNFLSGLANEENGYDRLDSYREFLDEKGLAPGDNPVISCEPTQEACYDRAREILEGENRPTAILVINDYLAMSVLRAAADLGIGIPEDLSVCGFDNIPDSGYSVPRLTTVGKDTEDLGAQAFLMLLDRMNGYDGPPRSRSAESSIIIRESTGPAPVK